MGYLDRMMGDAEKVLFTTRRHWQVVAGRIFIDIFLSVIIVAIAVALLAVTTGLSIVLLILLLGTLGQLLITCLRWWNEQYIVTNRRIIQMEGIFNKHVIDSSLEKVNDVVLDQSFMGQLLGYGNLEILTASDIGINKLQKIARPIQFKTTMLNAKEALTSDDFGQHVAPPQPSDKQSITALISELAALKDKGLLTEDEFQAKKRELLSRL